VNLTDLVPPHSVEAEQGVLGGLLLDNSTWDLIADTVSAQDFFRREHRLIFQAIQSLAAANQGFDVVTVSDSMAEVPEAGGLGYLNQQ
jgi:replicative DNA helicase